MIALPKIAIIVGVLLALLVVLLYVPPVRDWFFGNKVWPFATPWDVTPADLRELKAKVLPGDIIVERNLHSWHWMLLCKLGTGSSWVHVAMVDNDKHLISMQKIVRKHDFSNYLEKQSTHLVLLRPPYKDKAAIQRSLSWARAQLGTPFDAEFKKPAGSCAGLIGAALEQAGIDVPKRRAFGMGRVIYTAVDLFAVEGVEIIWVKGASPTKKVDTARSRVYGKRI